MKSKIVLSIWALLLLQCIIINESWAQTVRITGKITSKATGEVLAGANVSVKGTTTNTVTDERGSYSISASPGDILVVSYADMKTIEQAVTQAGSLDFSLDRQQGNLDEVVVIGYGTQKRKTVTGAVSSVKAADLENMPVVRVENSLQGRISGVQVTANSGQPGDASKVRIRGTSSLTAGTDPIYVVDGVIIGGGIDFLNQSDIESIDVLKDAASAAIYGTQASNGVILVTTKKGKSGKIGVNYNGYLGTQAPWRKLKLLNATEYATLQNEALLNGGKPIRYSNPAALGVGTDWQAAIMNNSAFIQNHELSLSSSTDKSSYYTSFGYFDQDGIVATSNSFYKRFTARFNSTHKVNSRITFGNNIAYAFVRSRGVGTNSEWGTPLNRAINLDPLTPLVVTDPAVAGQAPYTNSPYVVRDEFGNPYGISTVVTSEILNPLAALQIDQGFGWSHKITGNIFGEVELIKGLKFRSQVNGDLAFWGNESFTPLYYLNTINKNEDLNSYTRGQNRGLFYIWDNTLTYDKKFGNHSINVLAGTSAQKNKGESISATKRGIPVNNIRDASMIFPVPADNQSSGGSEYLSTMASLFGRITYDYSQKYLLTLIYRRDGSSKFGPSYKYGHFPSVSAGWVVSEESFFQNVTPVSFLKLRASYGVNGNDRIRDFAYLSTVSGGRNYTINGQLINGVSPNALSNPDLRWEETAQTNIGLDATVFKNFSVSLDWFNKKTSGLLLQVDVPDYVGNVGPVQNIGTMENRGVELELGYRNRIGELNLGVNGNISYLKNEVTFLTDNNLYLPNRQTFSPQGVEMARITVGHPIDYFFGFKTNGLFQNNKDVANHINKDGGLLQPAAKPGDIRFVDTNGDGVIDNNDRVQIGNPTPKWTYGFTLNMDYKNFDLVIFGQGVADADVFQAIRRFDLPNANYSTVALGRWTGEGSSNYFPRLVDGDPNNNFSRSSDFYVQDGSYFRIKTLQIGYTVPAHLIKKTGLNKLRFYIMSNNLLTLTKYNGYDPEIGSSNGIDRGIYPQARAFMGGLNIGF